MATGETLQLQVNGPAENFSKVVIQPKRIPSIRPKTIRDKPVIESRIPARSAPFSTCGSLVSGINRDAPIKTIITIGILIRNAQCHDETVVSQPPTTGPTAAIPPIVEPQIANAIPRSLPLKRALTVESVAGRTIAPPTPCKNRAKIKVAPEEEKLANTLAIPNTIIPTTSSFLRPCRSPTLPNVIRRAAKTNE